MSYWYNCSYNTAVNALSIYVCTFNMYNATLALFSEHNPNTFVTLLNLDHMV